MFKCQPGYTLRKIKGINYLLPYGQQIADLKKGFVLNETSTFLWNVLQHHEGAEPQQLAEILARTYQLDESYYPELLKDVTDFLTQLTAMGMITEDLHLISTIPSVSMIIAGICIKLYGSAELISPNFKPFYHEFSDDDTSQEIELVTTPPPSRCYGQVLLQNSEMTVFENPDRYVVLFPQMQNLYEAHMLKDGTYVRVYCHPQVSETNIENLFHAIRLFFLFTAQRNGLFAIHSASVLYQGKAWLFSGPSGMGKSTHTALWKKLFDTPFLNGDLNLIGKEGDQFVVYGIPWCGTSEIFTVEKKELGGIVLLEKAPEDKIVSLTKEQKTLRVMQRMISPPWTAGLMKKNLAFAEEIANEKPVYFLRCTKNDTAAEVMHHRITEDELAQEALK